MDAPPSAAAVISREMVKLLRETTGRGPVQARTTIGRDHVMVVLQDALTQGERNLVAHDMGDQVLAVRRSYQMIMQEQAVAMVQETLGRRVLGFMSDNHLDPDVGVEVFILDRSEGSGIETPQEAGTEE